LSKALSAAVAHTSSARNVANVPVFPALAHVKLQRGPHPMPRLSPSWLPGRRCCVAFGLAVATALPGCVDGGALVQARQDEIDLARVEEIDIGEFRITLPHALGAEGGGVVCFRAFGQVAVRDRMKVEEKLALHTPELRYRILLLVRSMTRAQLEEPSLDALRTGIAKLANTALDKKLIKNVGFYKFAFTPH
jgi:hypothetical protein